MGTACVEECNLLMINNIILEILKCVDLTDTLTELEEEDSICMTYSTLLQNINRLENYCSIC